MWNQNKKLKIKWLKTVQSPKVKKKLGQKEIFALECVGEYACATKVFASLP